MSAAASSVVSSVGGSSVVVHVAVAPSAVPTATPRKGESANKVTAADAVGIVASSDAGGEETLTPDDPKETAAVEAVFAVAPPVASSFISGEGLKLATTHYARSCNGLEPLGGSKVIW